MGSEHPVAVTLFRKLADQLPLDALESVAVSRASRLFLRYNSSGHAGWAADVLAGGTKYSPIQLDNGLALPGGNNFVLALDELVASRIETQTRRAEFLCSSLLSSVMSEINYDYGTRHPREWLADWKYWAHQEGPDAESAMQDGLNDGSVLTPMHGWYQEQRVREVELEEWRSMLTALRLAVDPSQQA